MNDIAPLDYVEIVQTNFIFVFQQALCSKVNGDLLDAEKKAPELKYVEENVVSEGQGNHFYFKQLSSSPALDTPLLPEKYRDGVWHPHGYDSGIEKDEVIDVEND